MESKPTKAPLRMNKMLDVSMWYVSVLAKQGGEDNSYSRNEALTGAVRVTASRSPFAANRTRNFIGVTFGWYRHDGTFHYSEQGLLHTLPSDVSRTIRPTRWFSCDLVNFIDINNSCADGFSLLTEPWQGPENLPCTIRVPVCCLQLFRFSFKVEKPEESHTKRWTHISTSSPTSVKRGSIKSYFMWKRNRADIRPVKSVIRHMHW